MKIENWLKGETMMFLSYIGFILIIGFYDNIYIKWICIIVLLIMFNRHIEGDYQIIDKLIKRRKR